jgi:UDP-N-acetylmuramoyl-L-alanyl-D-glutamate--2,6-diaminopimelate ligase
MPRTNPGKGLPMKLDALLERLVPVTAEVRKASCDVTSICDDSRAAAPGCLFVARAGTRSDGRAFVADAVAKGAAAVLHAGDDPCADASGAERVLRVRVPDGTDLARLAGAIADRLEGSPTEWLRLVGITGTNGKTTMAFLVQQFVQAAGERCGVIGTVVIDDGAVAEPASLTTPGGIEAARALGRMVRNGCTACAMEVSSHALDQGRADALHFRTAVFSNLTGDHLDYHGTMEHYAAAKARLFRMLPTDGVAVVNADDPWHVAMLQGCGARVLRCRVGVAAAPAGEAECTATIHESRLGWQDTTFAGPWGGVRVRLPIVGRHNAMNALQAAAAAWSIGVPAESIAKALAGCTAPPGRLEPVTGPADPFAVLVDYAHTDDALENVLTALRPLVGAGGRLVTVFGCGGDRDRTKRPRMMAVACRHSDRVVVTSDNPRTEDPEAIIDEVLAGRPEAGGPAVVRQADRARAIELAVSEARPGDIVLVAGKGHEDYQIVGTEKRAFDDRKVALAVLGRSGAASAVALASR